MVEYHSIKRCEVFPKLVWVSLGADRVDAVRVMGANVKEEGVWQVRSGGQVSGAQGGSDVIRECQCDRVAHRVTGYASAAAWRTPGMWTTRKR
ncbi:hypothetical protein BaRGS_00019241 [Batillaria attramentaria]|uniref:Uncharacterized protein n=1 Tax=Batillaria attramentaria TaxID=370345 RepID=A0ABD0KQY7_9CAEN